MINYREILRLSNIGTSQRQIASSVHSSRNTVKDVLDMAETNNITWPLDNNITNEQLEKIFFPEKYASDSVYLEPDYEYIHEELAKPKVTMTLLWNEYVHKAESMGKKPYMTTQFSDKYHSWAKITKATMRIQHKPGDAVEVDWAGQTLPIYDSVSGESEPAYLFVAVLPCSGYTYAELTSDMKMENWLRCHIHAFEYFGGTARLLIPDNLKTGVTRNSRYETVLNRSYQELAEYYDTAIVPARVEHPRDKSHAEGAVKFASTWILAALRNEHFFTLNDAEDAAKIKLEELNQRPFTSGTGCRRSAYFNEEKEFMKPLPAKRYETAVWNPNITVGADYLIADGLNKYSVPFDLIGKKVDIRLTYNTVEVFFHGSRVASHVRKTSVQREPIINPDHMTPEHRKYLNYNTESFIDWSKSVGNSTEQVIRCFLNAGKEPEQGFKSCAGIMKLCEKYGGKKLEAACAEILNHRFTPSVRLISTVLKNGVIVKSQESRPEYSARSTGHGITRGAAYYSKISKDGESK